MNDEYGRPLGKIALQKKAVSPADAEASGRNPSGGTPPSHSAALAVVTQAGANLEPLRLLSEKHGVPGIDLSQVAIHGDHLALIPHEVSESRLILCVLARKDRLFLAMANPGDRRVIDEVEFVTGRKAYPYVAAPDVLRATIELAYHALGQGQTYYLAPNVPEETLKQIGLTPPPKVKAAPAPPPPASARPAPGPNQAHGAAVVVDKALSARTQDDGDWGTSEFGNVSAEISSVMSLPEEFRNVAPGRAGTSKDPSLQGKLVLIVDDEEEIRKMLARLMTQKGMRVLEADRGQLALRLVKEHTPDVILLDAMLPEIHGFDIARRIKGSERYGRIPIVMISAVYKGWRIAEDLKTNYGIDAYLEKPFKISDVVQAVSNALRASAASAEIPARDPEALHEDAERCLQIGIEAYRAGDMDRAIETLRRGISIDPLAYRMHFHLGLLYGKKGMIYEGIQELERAVDLNPKHFPAQKNLAVLYEKAGFKNKAVELWTRCVQVAPDDATRTSVKQHLMQLL